MVDEDNALLLNAEFSVHGHRGLPCIWRQNCANEFLCIDPRGHVAQCDCWVTSYPEFRYGKVFDPGSLTDLLLNSPVLRRFQDRPGFLMQSEDCLECDYLSLCHGGCPVRAYTFHGSLLRKDPYCRLYRQIFQAVDEMAAERMRRRRPVFNDGPSRWGADS